LWRFSTITTEASTITPMAMAIPPRLMMLALMPSHCIPMKAIRTLRGSVTTATKAERRWRRKSAQTAATASISWVSFSRSVAIARWMRRDRS
jgi:hypothetical protein